MLVRVIDSARRLRFSRQIVEMHRDRKRVFVDQLGWELCAPGSWLEIDQFDTDHTVYLVLTDEEDERHIASVRLNPTERPHMLNTVFADLCEGGPVIGPDVWESSRFTIAPIGLRGTQVMRVSQYLALAHAEFALLNNIGRYTMIGETHRVATVVSMGWRVRPLCLPRECDGDKIVALEVTIDEETLSQMRARFGIERPVLAIDPDDVRWAA
jgi:N-acyl-L-homoserine lactone synthetase